MAKHPHMLALVEDLLNEEGTYTGEDTELADRLDVSVIQVRSAFHDKAFVELLRSRGHNVGLARVNVERDALGPAIERTVISLSA